MARLKGTDTFFLSLRGITVAGTLLWLFLFAPASEFLPVLTVVGIFVAYSLLLLVLVFFLTPQRTKPIYLGVVIPDLLFITALTRLTGGAASSFFLAYYILAAGQAYHFGALTGTLVAGASTLLYAAGNPAMLDQGHIGAFVLRCGFLYMLVAFMGYFHQRQKIDSERIERLMESLRAHSAELETAKTALESRALALATLNDVGVAINSVRDLDEVFQMIVELASRASFCDQMILMLLDEDGELRSTASRGLIGHYTEDDLPRAGCGIVGQSAVSGTIHLVVKPTDKSGFSGLSLLESQAASIVSLPIRTAGVIQGVLAGFRREGHTAITDEEVSFLETMCAQAGVAIDNARLYRDIETHYFNTVSALINAVEARDPYQRGHSDRVTAYATLIARQMGLTDQEIDEVERGARLHDIGKIGVSDTILQKPAPLEADEMSQVQEHPEIGERIVEPVRFMEETRRLIRQHHERIDGAGYPDGLAGDQLNPKARILVVADAFDAMLSDRPYRKALSKEKALSELRACSGSQFDAKVVEALEAALGQRSNSLC